ncbi:MAG: peptidoglycan bridge formation glycyltransferase FemA/FemB family protein [bacterium]|nr:peptidoglycan bridge formation glycyltransferase FemA/FemB family protein [bacterium]
MSVYQWEPYTTNFAEEWDRLVQLANDGTYFQTRRFLSYHEEGKFEDCSLVLKKKGNLWGVLPAAVRYRQNSENTSSKWFVSHPGASYGGIMTKKIVAFDEAEEILRSLIEHVKNLGFQGLEITPPPICYHRIPSDVWSFVMMMLGFQYRKRDYTQIVPLWFEDPTLFYDNKTLGGLRFAEKQGVVVKEVELSEENWDIFYPMLIDNRKKYGVLPAHSRRDLSALSRLVPEMMKLYFAYDRHQQVVAASLIFDISPQVTMTFYITHDRNKQDTKAVLPLNHFSIVKARERGARWLDFGISTVVGVPGYGLIRFKENFGAVGGWRDVYYYEFS